ncbi:MAG: thioredoxin domain-containing protein [Candidatus Kerfeldbacteria bacterium]
MEGSSSSKKSFFDTMPPQFAFWAGVVTSAAVISIAGFIVMLVIVLDDGEKDDNDKKVNTNTDTVAAADTGAAAPTADGSVDLEGLRNNRGEGDVTIIEYSDIDCPYCKQYHDTAKDVLEKYDGRVKLSYKHFPLTSLHPEAASKANAAECAGDQGLFWEFLDAMFDSSTEKVADGSLVTLAGDTGLDAGQFEECLNGGDFDGQVSTDASEAQSLGGNGTPFSVIVDGDGNVLTTISGALSLDSMSQKIEPFLE